MPEIQRIQDQLKRSMTGPAWHGPALRELLAGVTAGQAADRPIAGAHSVWEIVLHVTAWQQAVTRRIAGEPVELSGEQDWPPAKTAGENEWNEALAALDSAHDALQHAIGTLDDARLADLITGTPRPCSIYLTLHGIIQHNLYHAGQIALIGKMDAQPAPR